MACPLLNITTTQQQRRTSPPLLHMLAAYHLVRGDLSTDFERSTSTRESGSRKTRQVEPDSKVAAIPCATIPATTDACGADYGLTCASASLQIPSIFSGVFAGEVTDGLAINVDANSQRIVGIGILADQTSVCPVVDTIGSSTTTD